MNKYLHMHIKNATPKQDNTSFWIAGVIELLGYCSFVTFIIFLLVVL